ncbi:MAG: bifunctional methylenetetrahydrofolate dehydrogenase/methenyltetrahydrofolate cyclohydrolase [Elusimicrobia bacterium RIFCSPLOWO2_01_FULL_64_13]|nr:MAG: bifunctional methylenetetrahydrofolate dehydrogenase/methenyltetrahydrofolate cyclohydrolase [Elusimicrobia bacterium RIFCSPHIGHO2_01_FULL_64_10]OGR96289.1 MAG: bifunctional methylenetetrahydrofolate dehydrogenase/methenyltetrahydrofolate cyclohydrolase [Elusimicrobia bacterium RIFCSPLOWO2_01_FULL_64_13]
MTANILDGKAIAKEIREEAKIEADDLKSRGVHPGLATLLVGEDPASQIYVRNKHKACAEAGIDSWNHVLPKESSTQDVAKKVRELNADPKVHAILVQLPLPPQVDAETVLTLMDPAKDADGFHIMNLGRLLAAKDISELTGGKHPLPLPCTPHGVIKLIEKTGTSLKGRNALVIGRSLIVGKPAALLLMAHHATVTIAHSRTQDLKAACLRADILVAATGKARMITGGMIQPGAVVIDVGINRLPDGSLCGDVDFEAAKSVAGWITPVPGGVGPMTIAMLLKNTIALARGARPA